MEVFLDALLDTLKVLPFILIIYILIELLEHKTSFTKNQKFLGGNLAPLVGAATGIIPQCGFSVMAVKLYDKGYIRTGTLLAVFLATSDEALIVMIVDPAGAAAIAPLIVIKLAVALIAGYSVNFIMRKEKLAFAGHMEEEEHGAAGESGEDIHCYSCGREHEGKSNVRVYFVDPLLHSLKIWLYIFIVTLVFGYIFEYNEDAILSAFVGGPYVEPLVAAAVGLIPNCASSAVLAQTYCEGGILFGSLVAGLCCNAGLGFVVLLKNTKKIKRNLALIIALYAISVLVGIAVNAVVVACGWA